MKGKETTINIGKTFNRFPAGRTEKDGIGSGEEFRKKVLSTALGDYEVLNIEMDDTLGYGSSFLEEAFGGLVRDGFSASDLRRRIRILSEDDSLKVEIFGYIDEASKS